MIERIELKKKYQTIYLDKLIDMSFNAYSNSIAAYQMVVNTEGDKRYRHYLLKKSLNYIYVIQSQLSVYYDLFRYEKRGLSSKEITNISELLNKCINTLKDAISYYNRLDKEEDKNGSKCNC